MIRKSWLTIFVVCLFIVATMFVAGCEEPDEVVEEPEEEPVEEPEEDLAHLSIATTATGGSGYIQGGNLAAVVNPLQDVFEVYPMASAGAIENLALVQAGEADIGYTPTLFLEEGYLGEGDLEEHPDLRRLFTCGVSYGVFLVDADTDIYEMTKEDLEGHTINWGLPAQTTRQFNNILFDVIGLEPGVNFEAVELGTGDAFDALRDRHIDAASQGATPELASLVELMTTRDIRILDMPDDVFEEFNERAGGILFRAEMPAEWYPGLEEDVDTWIQTIDYFAHKDADEEVMYQFTKHFWENIDELAERDAAFAGLTIDEAVVPLDIPLHPGAERYFEEEGIIE